MEFCENQHSEPRRRTENWNAEKERMTGRDNGNHCYKERSGARSAAEVLDSSLSSLSLSRPQQQQQQQRKSNTRFFFWNNINSNNHNNINNNNNSKFDSSGFFSNGYFNSNSNYSSCHSCTTGELVKLWRALLATLLMSAGAATAAFSYRIWEEQQEQDFKRSVRVVCVTCGCGLCRDTNGNKARTTIII